MGIVPHLALALTGGAAVLAASPLAFATVKWLGVAYLLYMAWGTWRQTGMLTPDDGTSKVPAQAWRVIASAVLVNLLNPKLTIFFFVFLPMFVDPRSDDAVMRMLGLGLAFAAITLVVFALYGVAAAWLRRHVIERPAVVRLLGRGFAVAFVALAATLAVTDQ